MLIVHASKDYRLPETDGISAYHALRQCVCVSLSYYRLRGAEDCQYIGKAFRHA
jgi:hypothetical protein